MPYCVAGAPLQFVPLDTDGKCPQGAALVLSQAEYEAVTLQPTLNEIFKIPPQEDLATAFAGGFFPPLTLALIAWGVGAVVRFFR